MNLYGFTFSFAGERGNEKISEDFYGRNLFFTFSWLYFQRRETLANGQFPVCFSLDLSGESKALATEVKEGIDIYGARGELISYLTETVKSGMVLVSREGTVDLHEWEIRCSVILIRAHRVMRRSSGKGLMRVANMCGLSAVTIREGSWVSAPYFCAAVRSPDIREMLLLAKKYEVAADEMTERYFGNLNMYFEA